MPISTLTKGIEIFFTFQSGYIQIDIADESYYLTKSFTFQSGYIQIAPAKKNRICKL